jgi:energy-coupling factor transport system permease protein
MPFGLSGRKHRQKKRARYRELISYEPGESFLHRLDPRTKIAALLAVSAAALFFSSLTSMAIILAVVILLALASGLGGRLYRAFFLILPFMAVIIILDSFFAKVSDGPVFFSAQLWILHAVLTPGSILFAVSMGLRLLAIAFFSFLFIITTSHDDFIRSLQGMRVPPTLAFSLGYALRSTTALSEDVANIMDAQRSRGLDFDAAGIVRSRTNLMAVFTPVTVSLLKRSKHVTDAMQSRGFLRSGQKTCYSAGRFGRDDLVMAGVLVLLVVTLAGTEWIAFLP